MIKLTKQQIKEIASELDCGMRCFIDKETGTIKTVLNFESWQGGDRESWEDVLSDLEGNWDKYIEVDGMESRDSFELMADFAESVDSIELRNSLINALNKRHPFKNFKWVVDNSGQYRQKWFDFKDQRLIEWVEDQLDHLNLTNDNE